MRHRYDTYCPYICVHKRIVRVFSQYRMFMKKACFSIAQTTCMVSTVPTVTMTRRLNVDISHMRRNRPF